jgi:hypothetical protein
MSPRRIELSVAQVVEDVLPPSQEPRKQGHERAIGTSGKATFMASHRIMTVALRGIDDTAAT